MTGSDTEYRPPIQALAEAFLGPPTEQQVKDAERQRRRHEYRERLKSIEQTAITVALLIACVLMCAVAFEVWRILHEVTS